MEKKKSLKKIIIIIVILILLVVLAGLAYLYLTTDFLKSDKALFSKYLGKAVQNVESTMVINKDEDFEALLQNNKYKSKTEISTAFDESVGTTADNSQNVLNKLSILIDSKIDPTSNYKYLNMYLKKEDKNLAELEYLNDSEKTGIRFTDLFQQFLAVENGKVADTLSSMNINIPSELENFDLNNLMLFTDEEIETLNQKYLNVITQEFSDSNFKKTKGMEITVNDKVYNVNEFSLTITKEQLNNIYINILEEAKNDEILLAKIEQINNMYNANNSNNGQESLKEELVTYIDQLITEIKNKNIGDDEVTIKVYENKSNTVRVAIQTNEYTAEIDTIVDKTNKYLVCKLEKVGNIEDSYELDINKTGLNSKYTFIRTAGSQTYKFNLEQEDTITDGKEEKNIVISYKTKNAEIKANIKHNKEIVTNFDNKIDFNDNNVIVLSTLSNEDLEKIKNTVNDKMIEKQEYLKSEINTEDILTALKKLGILSEKITISDLGTLTKSEISKFNADFEFFKGIDLKVDTVNSLLEVVKVNLDTVEVLSESSIKLNITKGKNNEELANKVSQIINNDKNKDKKYTVTMEYDSESGIIKDVIIEIQK